MNNRCDCYTGHAENIRIYSQKGRRMNNGIGLLGILWFLFVGWLMLSSKSTKEMFLFYMWSTMIAITAVHTIYLLLFK